MISLDINGKTYNIDVGRMCLVMGNTGLWTIAEIRLRHGWCACTGHIDSRLGSCRPREGCSGQKNYNIEGSLTIAL
jgi:hypothetical protein